MSARVLVVDDDASIRYTLRGFLEDDSGRLHAMAGFGIEHLGGFHDLEALLEEDTIDEVMYQVLQHKGRGQQALFEALKKLRRR